MQAPWAGAPTTDCDDEITTCCLRRRAHRRVRVPGTYTTGPPYAGLSRRFDREWRMAGHSHGSALLTMQGTGATHVALCLPHPPGVIALQRPLPRRSHAKTDLDAYDGMARTASGHLRTLDEDQDGCVALPVSPSPSVPKCRRYVSAEHDGDCDLTPVPAIYPVHR